MRDVWPNSILSEVDLLFRKSWFRVGPRLVSVDFDSRDSIAEQSGHGWDAIESYTASEVDIGEQSNEIQLQTVFECYKGRERETVGL